MECILYGADPASVSVIQCSPPSWMAQMALEAKGASYRLELLSFARGEHRSAAMRELNPRATIPVLVHGGASIYETYAVLEYIDYAFAEVPLVPRERVGRARALTRLHEASNLKAAGMALFAYLMKTPEGARDENRVAKGIDELSAELDRWERVEPGDGFFGGALCLSDLCVFAYLATARRLGLDLAPWPGLRRFCEHMESLECVQKTWPSTWSSSAGNRPLASF